MIIEFDKTTKNKIDRYIMEYNKTSVEQIIRDIRANYELVERDIISDKTKFEEFCDIYKGEIISSSNIIEEYEKNTHRLAHMVIYRPLDKTPELVNAYEYFKNERGFKFLEYLENSKSLKDSHINIEKYRYLISKIKIRNLSLIGTMDKLKRQVLMSDEYIKEISHMQEQEEIIKGLCKHSKIEIEDLIKEARIDMQTYIELLNSEISFELIKSECYEEPLEEGIKLIRKVK